MGALLFRVLSRAPAQPNGCRTKWAINLRLFVLLPFNIFLLLLLLFHSFSRALLIFSFRSTRRDLSPN